MANKIKELYNDTKLFVKAARVIANRKKTPKAHRSEGTYSEIHTYSYDGEKTPQSMGSIRDYQIAYKRLRARSWQAYLESDICQTILGKYNVWLVGEGLRLESEPNREILEEEGYSNDWAAISRQVENRWKVWSNDEMSSNSSMETYNSLMHEASKSALVGGDCLVVHRVKNKTLTTQIIDGSHIETPPGMYGDKSVKHGVKLDEDGKHLGYYVKSDFNNYEYIQSYGKKSGVRMAFMVYGLKYRLDSVRGLPLLSVALQTISSIDRYKEAMVAGAESRANIAFSIEHDAASTGENPFQDQLAQLLDSDAADQPKTVDHESLAKTIRTMIKNETVNMPVGAKLKMHDSTVEMHFDQFFMSNINLIAASVGIPPEVAMSMYNSNYSASRAANKDWEHTLVVRRKQFATQSYKRSFSLFYDIQVMTNKFRPRGYLVGKDDPMIEAAFKQCRFVGAGVPNIDPVKEVKAERLKLGSLSDNIPLTDIEKSTEILGGGDYATNIAKYAQEIERAKELGLIQEAENNEPSE